MCFTLTMGQLRNLIKADTMSFAILLLGGCTSPIADPVRLGAIESEARSLIADHPIRPPNEWVDIPMNRLPPTIAALGPEAVAVHHWGVDIMMKPHFDGGYGYAVPKNKIELPMPAQCYSEIHQGVFWHGPC
jgi:hypothetical protein